MATPPPPPTGKTSRTVALSRLAPPRRSGYLALLVSLAILVFFFVLSMLMCTGIEAASALLTSPFLAIGSALSAILFGIPYLVLILWLDRNEKEPWHLVAIAFLWGAFPATAISGLFNGINGAIFGAVAADPAMASQLTASISAPFVEELAKGVALVLLYLFFHKDFDNVLDGIIYGAIVGLGFAVYENFTYYVNSGSLCGAAVLTYVRGILSGVATHVTFTGITGLGFGIFRSMRHGCARWLIPPAFLCAAMAVHFSWNTFTNWFMTEDALLDLAVGLPLAVVVLQVPFVIFLVSVAGITLLTENRNIRRYLADEGPPVLCESELKRLVPAHRRSLHSMGLCLTLQWGRLWRVRKRNHLLVKLAFERWHMDKEDKAGDEAQAHHHAVRVMRIRKQLKALPLE